MDPGLRRDDRRKIALLAIATTVLQEPRITSIAVMFHRFAVID
jgi:hypothetical protein